MNAKKNQIYFFLINSRFRKLYTILVLIQNHRWLAVPEGKEVVLCMVRRQPVRSGLNRAIIQSG